MREISKPPSNPRSRLLMFLRAAETVLSEDAYGVVIGATGNTIDVLTSTFKNCPCRTPKSSKREAGRSKQKSALSKPENVTQSSPSQWPALLVLVLCARKILACSLPARIRLASCASHTLMMLEQEKLLGRSPRDKLHLHALLGTL